MPAAANNGLPPLSQSDLADLSLRELLGMLLSSVGVAERKAYLERLLPDKPNGFYDRSLQLGTMPLDVRVPRTRSGDFRPASLPPLYQRGYSDETPDPVVVPSVFRSIAQCRQRRSAEDGPVQFPTGTGSGGRWLDRRTRSA